MRQRASRVAAALLVAAAGVALTHGSSSAGPGGHQVTYTITATKWVVAEVWYMAAEPPNITAYADDQAKYMYSLHPKLNEGVPWSTTTTLANPNQWATVSAHNHYGMQQPVENPGVNAGFHCELAIDGHVVLSKQGDRDVECTLRHWSDYSTPGGPF